MNAAETKRIYEASCRAKRIAPQEDEGRTWHRVLRSHEARDVEKALDEWWADTTPDLHGQPRGKWLPAPAELKPFVEKIAAHRESASRETEDMMIWVCSGPVTHTCSGFIAHSEDTPGPKRCHCGAERTVSYRGRA
jgi:hypothetical protein